MEPGRCPQENCFRTTQGSTFVACWALFLFSPLTKRQTPVSAEVMDDTAASIQDRLPTPFPLDVCETKFPTRRAGRSQPRPVSVISGPNSWNCTVTSRQSDFWPEVLELRSLMSGELRG